MTLRERVTRLEVLVLVSLALQVTAHPWLEKLLTASVAHPYYTALAALAPVIFHLGRTL